MSVEKFTAYNKWNRHQNYKNIKQTAVADFYKLSTHTKTAELSFKVIFSIKHLQSYHDI